MTARLLLALSSLACSQAAGAQAKGTTPGAYMEIHKQAAGDGPKLKESEHVGKIVAAQDGLAARIRAARPNAKPGDIFTPAVRETCRALIYPSVPSKVLLNLPRLPNELEYEDACDA